MEREVRPPAHYAFSDRIGVAVLSSRVCAFLFRHGGLEQFRVEVRGQDPELDAQLTAMAALAAGWRSSVTGTPKAAEPELDRSSEWLSTTQVAGRLRMTDRGVRRAIQSGRLRAENVAGRWRVSRESFEHFRSNR